MKKSMTMLLAAVLLSSCTEKKGHDVKAPTRVSMEIVSAKARHILPAKMFDIE